jgi:translation initiation factor IF-3
MYRPVNKHFQPPKPIARINELIKAPEVRVLDHLGEHVGVMPIAEALAMAREQELDLVEVNGAAVPPLVRLIEYDKYRYQVEKSEQHKKKQAKRVELKSIRLSVRIGTHDLDTKAKQTEKFLEEGKKVKVEMVMRGREKANAEYAYEQLKKFLTTIHVAHAVEQEPKRMGGTISTILNPS